MSATVYLIGLTGPAGSGKDSAADALRPHGYQSIAFADALRAEIAAAWRVDQRLLSDRATKELPLPALAIGMCCEPAFLHWAVYHGHSLHEPRSARWLMQRWGTEFRRSSNPDYWVHVVRHWVRRQTGIGCNRLIVTDVRMPNEAAFIRSVGGRIVRLHRPELVRLAPDTQAHASEWLANAVDADTVVHNEGPLHALPAEVERAVFTLFGFDALSGTGSTQHPGAA